MNHNIFCLLFQIKNVFARTKNIYSSDTLFIFYKHGECFSKYSLYIYYNIIFLTFFIYEMS